jgi:hypothetical protein
MSGNPLLGGHTLFIPYPFGSAWVGAGRKQHRAMTRELVRTDGSRRVAAPSPSQLILGLRPRNCSCTGDFMTDMVSGPQGPVRAARHRIAARNKNAGRQGKCKTRGSRAGPKNHEPANRSTTARHGLALVALQLHQFGQRASRCVKVIK